MGKNQREQRHLDSYYNFKEKTKCLNEYTDNQLNRTVTMFKWKNLPDSIPEREMELITQTGGYGIFAKGNNGELLFLWGNFAPPLNAYYMPTKILVTNPWANINKEFTIGEDCVLMRNDPLNTGLLPIIRKYGVLDVESNISLKNATINLRTMFNIIASNDTEYKSAMSYLDKLEAGENAAMMNEFMSNGITTQPYSQGSSGYLTQLIELKQYIKGSFLNEIGLNANYNMKRERLNSSEVELNEDYLRPLIDSMLEERQKACEQVNKMFGTNIEVEFNSSWQKYNINNYNESINNIDANTDNNSEDVVETNNNVELENDIEDNNENIIKQDESTNSLDIDVTIEINDNDEENSNEVEKQEEENNVEN